jgi:aconitate hydratase
VQPRDFNSYGARRGNDEVMVRGTFANIRLRNRIRRGPAHPADDALPEGGLTLKLPEGLQMSIYDASLAYIAEGTPLVVLAGKEYGSGSSRDWAAKGTRLLGVRAVLAQSFERIHRSNLIGMGVLPLQLPAAPEDLGLGGDEVFSITGLAAAMNAGEPVPAAVTVRAGERELSARVRIDTPQEAEYFRHGGILQYVLRQLRDRA